MDTGFYGFNNGRITDDHGKILQDFEKALLLLGFDSAGNEHKRGCRNNIHQ